MCALAVSAMQRANEALLDSDLSLAEQVIADHEHIAAYNHRIEESAFRLLVLQQPVASELRTVVGSMHIAADIDRMGALAVHVADISGCAIPNARCRPRCGRALPRWVPQAVQLAQHRAGGAGVA